MTKNYSKLANHFIPLGDQAKLGKNQVMEMLEERTKIFTREEIEKHWPAKKPQ